MSGSSAGFSRPGLACERCGKGFSLVLGIEDFENIETLPDPFPAKCPLCSYEAIYPKSAIGVLLSVGSR